MKKIIKNKYILSILLIAFFSLFVLLYIINVAYAIIYMFLNVVIIIVLLNKIFEISMINFDKIKNISLIKKIRKNISESERYVEKIKIDTFDGSGGTTHPCILYFDNGFNGYKYWMVHTPYDNNNIELENPSIAVSNDGFNFEKPNNIKDPLLPIIKRTNKSPTYYNDPCFLFEDNKLQIWYRFTIENKENGKSKTVDSIFRIISEDGINWSEPELIIDDHESEYLSISIIKIKGLYYLYYFDLNLEAHCKTSKDLINWSEEKTLEIKRFDGNFWHGEAKLINDKIYLLFLSKDYKLYLCETTIHRPLKFDKCDELNFNYYDERNIYGNVIKYKSTFLIDDNYINFYIPFRVNTINWFKIKGIKHQKWTMTNTYLTKDNFEKIIKK